MLLACGLGALLAVGASSSVAEAQRPLRANAKKNVTFGTLFAGVPLTVLPTDAVRAGAVDITGPNSRQILVTFTLPTSMMGPAGALLPVSFTPTSAGFSTGSIATQVRFDPRVPYRAFLSNNGRGTVYLGAIATPGASQRSGNYNATIVMTVALTGL